MSAAHPKVFGLSSGTWGTGEPTGQIQCTLSCRAEEDKDEHWGMSMERGLTGGPTSVYQSSEPPCRVCSVKKWQKHTFLISLPDFIEFPTFTMVPSLGLNSFSYVTLWTFLNDTSSKIRTEQCWINLQTCLSANPQCSCCSSLAAHWSSPFYWGCLRNFCLLRNCWLHTNHTGTIPRYHIKCIDLLQLLVWPS